MKTKLLRKLRKKAKKRICLVQTGNYDWQVRKYLSDGYYKILYWIGGAWPLGGALDRMYEYRRDYILSEVKRMRKSKYPKIINI